MALASLVVKDYMETLYVCQAAPVVLASVVLATAQCLPVTICVGQSAAW